jgi:hypothetical protein
MKLTLFALLAGFFATGCTNTLYTHRKDFSPVERKGAWNDYYESVRKGEEPQPPKEKKQ